MGTHSVCLNVNDEREYGNLVTVEMLLWNDNVGGGGGDGTDDDDDDEY